MKRVEDATGGILNAARHLFSLQQGTGFPLGRNAHWQITPDALADIRRHMDAFMVLDATSSRKWELFGIPIRIAAPGTIPVIDLVSPPPLNDQT